MIKINIIPGSDKVRWHSFGDDIPIPDEKIDEAIQQLFKGRSINYIILGHMENGHIKVDQFLEEDMFGLDDLYEADFEKFYHQQTGGWWGVDIINVFDW